MVMAMIFNSSIPVFAASWIRKADIANSAIGLLAASDGLDRIWVFGGWDISNSETFTTSEVYSFASNTWTAVADLPETLGDGKAIVLNGKIYLFAYANNYLYDPALDSYALLAPMPETRYAFSGETIDGFIYLCGGADTQPQFIVHKGCWKYDAEGDSFTDIADMSTTRFFHASAVIGGKMYVVAGLSDFSATELDTVEIYNPNLDTWSNGTSLPITWWGGVDVNLSGTIFIAQGESGGNIFTGGYVYDPNGDAWTAITGAADPGKLRQAGVELGGYPWSIGGMKTNYLGAYESTNIVEYYTDTTTTTTTSPTTTVNTTTTHLPTTTVPPDDDAADDDTSSADDADDVSDDAQGDDSAGTLDDEIGDDSSSNSTLEHNMTGRGQSPSGTFGPCGC